MIFDERCRMKPVTCAVDPFSGEIGKTADTDTVGKFQKAAKNSPKHALVVDDEPLVRWSVAECLSDIGLDVEQAGDAASALRTVTTSTPFDLVVMDLRLPDMKDLSLLGTIRQLLPSAMLVLMTAFGTPEIITAAQAMGATVLNKPFELDALKRIAGGAEA